MGNPFAFGAGGGRLTAEAMKILAPIFSFEYMGAAEYEFGAVPAGLNKIYQHASTKNLFFSTLNIAVKDVKINREHRRDEKLRTWTSCPVYVIGSKTDQTEIERRVTLIATDEDKCLRDMWKRGLHEGLSLHDPAQLNRFILVEPTYEPVVGWLELENGFFFTVDPIMAEKFAAIFGMLIEIKTAQL